MKRAAVVMSFLLVPLATAQPITPIFTWDLQPSLNDLPKQPSSTDLVQGFPETTTPGILHDEVINEFHMGTFGIIDEANGVFAFLMNTSPGACLAMIEGLPSDGFLPGYGGNPGQFVDGSLNGPTDGILRDFGRASLSLRFGFTNPTDIGSIRVIGGNFLNRDGRTFHHYDVWASTDGMGDFGNFFPVAIGVRTGEFTWVNDDEWAGSMTEVFDFDSKYLVQGATDLRFVFYCVSNTQAMFVDQWQGLFNDDPAFQEDCAGTEEDGDVDGIRKAFEASIIREIDVFAPGEETPWGDIDYDGDMDMIDAAALQTCFAGSTTSGGCYRFDFDENTDINIDDFATFAGMMTGPN